MQDDLKIIAHFECGFSEKFGIPRQSGLANTKGRIIFLKEYSNPDAFRGLEGFSHIWILWKFTGFDNSVFTPSVRPPRLGGNKKVGVFSTRSPNRPNPIGISSVELESIEKTNRGIVLNVLGADLKNGTEIIDIKPYLPFTDSHPNARFGFSQETVGNNLEVQFLCDTNGFPDDFIAQLSDILKENPKPSYQSDGRVYGMTYCDYEIKFTVIENIVKVNSIIKE